MNNESERTDDIPIENITDKTDEVINVMNVETSKNKYGLEIEDQFEKLQDNNLSRSEATYRAWEYVGFHRQLGGWFYGFGISIVSMIFGIIVLPWFIQNLYPFPEIRGYQGVSAILFAVLYKIFDFGTAYGIKRFIAEYRVKDLQKMLEYIRFFIWYQMVTGLFQVTIVSFIIFEYVPNGEFGYATWLMLISLQKQFPGMLGTFKTCVEGLQHHRVTHILNFITGEIFQNATNIIFILLGRYVGETNPAIGVIMGMAIGTAIGGYVDDFFAMLLSGYYFTKILKPYGIKFKDAWVPKIGKDVIRNCLYYGAQTSIVPIINTASGTWVGLMYLTFIPQWLSYTAIAGLASGVAGAVSVWNFGLTQNIAESYPSGKKKLSEFYVSYSFKWQWFIGLLMFVVLFSYLDPVIYFFNNADGFDLYATAAIFILPFMFNKIIGPIFGVTGDILNGTLHITFHTFARIIEEILEVFFTWIFVVILELGTEFGVGGIIFLIAFEHIFAKMGRTVIEWIYIERKNIMHIKIYWMSTLIIPIVSGLPVFLFAEGLEQFIFYPLVESSGIMVAAIVSILLGIFIIPFCIYLPMTGILGAWDDFLLWTWSEATKLSGPSKIFFVPFLKSIEMGVSIGKKLGLHNRFKIDWEEAQKEMIELNLMKMKAFE